MESTFHVLACVILKEQDSFSVLFMQMVISCDWDFSTSPVHNYSEILRELIYCSL